MPSTPQRSKASFAFWALLISPPDDGNVHPGVVLHSADESPIGLSFIHLATRAPVNGKGRYAHVLQPFGQFHDNLGVVVPAQAGLDGDGFVHGLHDGFGDGHHLVGLAHHTAAGAPAGNFAHRAAEVDVHYIGPVPAGQFGGFVGHFGGIHHGLGNAAVDLHGHRRFLLQGVHLGDGLGDIAHQAVRTHELGGDHSRPRLPAQDAETGVGDVLHGRQCHRALTQVYVSDFHGCKDSELFRKASGDRTGGMGS